VNNIQRLYLNTSYQWWEYWATTWTCRTRSRIKNWYSSFRAIYWNRTSFWCRVHWSTWTIY